MTLSKPDPRQEVHQPTLNFQCTYTKQHDRMTALPLPFSSTKSTVNLLHQPINATKHFSLKIQKKYNQNVQGRYESQNLLFTYRGIRDSSSRSRSEAKRKERNEHKEWKPSGTAYE